MLVVVAHPDDIDFGVAGTVATMYDHGVEVVYALATNGDAGVPAELPRAELRETRQAEQAAAAGIVGVSELLWLNHRDGHLEANLELRRSISATIRRVKPDLVISQSPIRDLDRIYASHPDHLAVGEACVSAVYPDSRNAHSFPELLDEGLEPHHVPRLWLMANAEVNLHVDITDAFERKTKALLAHHSQNDHWADELPGRIREWAAGSAEAAGLGPGSDAGGVGARLVESFRSIDAG